MFPDLKDDPPFAANFVAVDPTFAKPVLAAERPAFAAVPTFAAVAAPAALAAPAAAAAPLRSSSSAATVASMRNSVTQPV